MKSILSTLVAASTLALLTACGGDGGDSVSQSTPTVSISSVNQNDVARATVNGGLDVALAQGALGNGEAAAPDSASRSHALDLVVRRAIESVSQRRAVASADVHALAAHTATNDCAAGGTVASTFDDKDGNQQLTSGDVITAVFTQCRESATLIVNGTVVVTMSATPTSTLFTAAAQFQNVSVADASSTSTVSGTVAVSEVDSDTRSDSTILVGSGGLNVAVVSSGYNDTISFLQGFQIVTSEAVNGSTSSVSVSGAMNATSINGRVTLSTPVALSQADADAYPSSGQVLVTGASGSKLLLTVLSNSQVKLELDTNGDGTIDNTSTVAWSTLVP